MALVGRTKRFCLALRFFCLRESAKPSRKQTRRKPTGQVDHVPDEKQTNFFKVRRCHPVQRSGRNSPVVDREVMGWIEPRRGQYQFSSAYQRVQEIAECLIWIGSVMNCVQ